MADLLWLLGALAAFGLAVAGIRWLRPRAWPIRLLRGLLLAALFLLGTGCASASGWYFWFLHRPQPRDVKRTLFQGITYTRESLRTPRPIIVHTVRVDLRAPGIRFLVTPGKPAPGAHLRARKTSQFRKEFGVQVAVNGSFFEPWWSHTPWDFYPHVGDPVAVYGFASSEGVAYARRLGRYMTFNVTPDNRITISSRVERPYNALSGGPFLLEGGAPTARARARLPGEPKDTQPHPRTAAAIDRTGRYLLLVVVDGRQPNYSDGVTLLELAELIAARGGYRALNFDGGGSTTLAVEAARGRTRILNATIDKYIPGWERPVGNHLGIFALPVGGGDARG
jgi:hypothetical protein